MRILVPSITSTPAVGATALVCMMYSFFHTLVSVCVCVCVYDVQTCLWVCWCVGRRWCQWESERERNQQVKNGDLLCVEKWGGVGYECVCEFICVCVCVWGGYVCEYVCIDLLYLCFCFTLSLCLAGCLISFCFMFPTTNVPDLAVSPASWRTGPWHQIPVTLQRHRQTLCRNRKGGHFVVGTEKLRQGLLRTEKYNLLDMVLLGTEEDKEGVFIKNRRI